jgi:hypothetical protein
MRFRICCNWCDWLIGFYWADRETIRMFGYKEVVIALLCLKIYITWGITYEEETIW